MPPFVPSSQVRLLDKEAVQDSFKAAFAIAADDLGAEQCTAGADGRLQCALVPGIGRYDAYLMKTGWVATFAEHSALGVWNDLLATSADMQWMVCGPLRRGGERGAPRAPWGRPTVCAVGRPSVLSIRDSPLRSAVSRPPPMQIVLRAATPRAPTKFPRTWALRSAPIHTNGLQRPVSRPFKGPARKPAL